MVGRRRVLFVLPVDAPSSLVRGSVYRERLARDHDASFVSLYLPRLASWRQRASAQKPAWRARLTTAPFDLGIVATRAVLWQRLLRRVDRFDRIVLIKYFDGDAVSAIRRRSRAQILYDLDDAVWLPEFIGEHEFKRVLQQVDAVSCDNEYLRSHASSLNPRAFVLRGPVRLPPSIARPPNAKVIIAWIGSPSTLHYLQNLRAPLARLVASHPGRFVFRIVGAGHDASRWPAVSGLELQTVASYDEREMHRQLAEIDVGVFPLNQDENSLGRGILKATLYMGAAVPAVCSAIGELPTFLANGRDGFACATEHDWVGALVRLIDDREARQRIGAAGRLKIEQEFSLERCYSVLCDKFLD